MRSKALQTLIEGRWNTSIRGHLGLFMMCTVAKGRVTKITNHGRSTMDSVLQMLNTIVRERVANVILVRLITRRERC